MPSVFFVLCCFLTSFLPEVKRFESLCCLYLMNLSCMNELFRSSPFLLANKALFFKLLIEWKFPTRTVQIRISFVKISKSYSHLVCVTLSVSTVSSCFRTERSQFSKYQSKILEQVGSAASSWQHAAEKLIHLCERKTPPSSPLDLPSSSVTEPPALHLWVCARFQRLSAGAHLHGAQAVFTGRK